MVFCHTNNWVLIEGALGQSEYEQEMLLSSAETLSTFSTQWVQAVKESGRFSQCDWNKRQKIRMTTLDSLIHRYGPPSFVKIDVEGYEREVLSGLSIPLTAVSLEFTPEFISSTFSCIEHLSSLADFEFQISLGETMAMALPEWVSGTALKEHLSKISANSGNILFGDVYAKKKSGSR
jgi:FkbM family methyltransferase